MPTTINVIVHLPEPFLSLSVFAENAITGNIYVGMFEIFAFPTEL
jgi:hypothetical protein